MPDSNILVVVIDGLRASALGAYGNTTFPTPALDRFSAESLLFDWCYSPMTDLAGIYRALWPLKLGHHATLVTDEPQLATLPGFDKFQECIQLTLAGDKSSEHARADDIFQTQLARVSSAASEEIAQNQTSQSRLLWIHARGMYGPWDAPLDLQQSLMDDDDPPPVEKVTPPDFVASTAGDPDAAFRYSCAYAAQIAALDACWEALLDAVDSNNHQLPWLVLLIGARGYPLGEHGRIGGIDERLFTEQLHVPWLIRFPDGHGKLARSGALVTHADVMLTIGDWISGNAQAANSSTNVRDALLSTADGGAFCIRTAEWSLRDTMPSTETAAAELFVRPDDRWEANDIAKLCPDAVDELRDMARRALQ